MPLQRLTLACLAAVLAFACSPPRSMPPEQDPPRVLFSADPLSLDNPLPDLRLLDAGGSALRPEWYRPFLAPKAITARMKTFLDQWTDHARDIEGIGNFGATLLPLSEPVDRNSLNGIASRLRRTPSGYEVLEANVAVEHSRDALAASTAEVPADFPEFLVVRPSVPLPDGEDGMLVIRRGLKTQGGELFGRGLAYRDAPGSAEAIAQAAQTLGIAQDEVLLTLPLRAARGTDKLRSLAQWTLDAAAPAWTIPPHGTVPEGTAERLVGRWAATDADWGRVDTLLTRWSTFGNPADDVGQVIAGSFKARDPRQDGVWNTKWIEDPSTAPEVDLDFMLTLPKGPRPEVGWKVVIGAHGIGGRNTLATSGSAGFCMQVAEILAERGLGCLGIDAPSHGTRGNSIDFFAVEDMRKVRENFRQAAFDFFQLARLATVLDVDGDAQPDLSPDLGFFGNSLGAIMGANFVSTSPPLKYAVLNVPGGGLANILLGDSIRDKVGLLFVAETGITFQSPEYLGAFAMIRGVAQMFLEESDPVNVGQALKDGAVTVLVQQGLRDQTIPNFTTDNLAAAIGLEEATGDLSGRPIRAHVRVDPAAFGRPESFDGHNVFWYIPAARTQVLSFLESGGHALKVE